MTKQLELTADDLYEGLTVGERKEIPLKYFAWPEERKFPADTQDHLDSLATLIGRAPEAEQSKIKRNAIRIAKELHLKLPDSWEDEQQTTESAGQRPAKKIGSLKISWLEYNARSLNGRIYPKATCDRIFQSGQRALADTNGLPITCYVSHETANSNVNTELAGHISKLWQEGSKFWALIDLADTRVGHDMLALVENGALKSGSMRVLGVELMHDRSYDLPLVICSEGIEPVLAGIDLTTRPGLADSARITQVLYESAGQQSLCIESFNYDHLTIETKEEAAMPALPIYLQVALGVLQESTAREAHMRVHDHLAGVLDEAMGKAAHGSESARLKALVEGQFDEAIAKKHMARLVAAHDESAKQLGMKCEGCYGDMAPSDTDNDGDNPAAGFDPDQDREAAQTPPALTESHKEDTTLTEEEMLAALKAKGFTIEAPKTAEDKLAALEAQIAEQNAKIAALSETASQRQTLAAPSQLEESTLQEEELYQEGDYLKSDLAPKNWRALSNRRVPWPKDLDPKLALHEMAPFLAHTLNMQEANARGRDISAFIQPNEVM